MGHLGLSTLDSQHMPYYPFPDGAEIATPALWPSVANITTTDAGLTGFGPVSGVRIALNAGSNGVWWRAFHDPAIELVPGATYRCTVWYYPGTSGRIRLDAYGNDGADTLQILGPVGNLFVQNTDKNFTVTNLVNEKVFGGAYLVSFMATMDPAASSTPSLGIGPQAENPGEDVILLAADLELVDPEEGLIQTGEYPIGNIPTPNQVVRQNPIVFAADFFGLDPDGVGGLIAEFGGSGIGVSLGFDRVGTYAGALIFRFGNGGARWQSDTFWAAYDKSVFAGDVTIVVSLDFDGAGDSIGRVFANGREVLPITGSGPIPLLSEWAGTDQGNYLSTAVSKPFDEDGTPVTYTSASSLRTYAGQTVSL